MMCMNCGRTLIRDEKGNAWICKTCGYIQTVPTSAKAERVVKKSLKKQGWKVNDK